MGRTELMHAAGGRFEL